MVKLLAEKEEEHVSIVEEKTLPQKPTIEENEEASVLQKLKSEEAYLLEEKQNLATLKEKLQLKAKEEIELRTQSIQKLKTEITTLKTSCEALTKSLNAGVLP